MGISHSRDKGKTWSRLTPAISFFSASAPAIIGTRDNVLVLATRMWGIFTSVDNGQTWSLPTHIGGYTGSGGSAGLLKMPDGRILVINAMHGLARSSSKMMAQFIRVDRDGAVHPALPGPANSQ